MPPPEVIFRAALTTGPVIERIVAKAIEERVVKASKRRKRINVSTGAVLYLVANEATRGRDALQEGEAPSLRRAQ